MERDAVRLVIPAGGRLASELIRNIANIYQWLWLMMLVGQK
jgi:hypothetical protein